MKKYLPLLIFVPFVVSLAAQSTTRWKTDLSPQKVFIENKGQFDGENNLANSQTLFATDRGPCMVYFTNTGLTFKLEKRKKPVKAEHEGIERRNPEEREEEEHKLNVKTDFVQMQWLNTNPGVVVTGLDEAQGYYNFGLDKGSINRVRAFNKIVYKNLYPNIDVEYVFHAGQGIEYSLILHPGADITQVKMSYSDVPKAMLDGNGNMHLGTMFGDIIDHAPLTFYAEQK
ncbi:MAG TPA: hypothetical protein VG603_05275, partial [Chitinophagales bacterium]|nr:hypothetical protein [Chitinophagales bacterium]